MSIHFGQLLSQTMYLKPEQTFSHYTEPNRNTAMTVAKINDNYYMASNVPTFGPQSRTTFVPFHLTKTGESPLDPIIIDHQGRNPGTGKYCFRSISFKKNEDGSWSWPEGPEAVVDGLDNSDIPDDNPFKLFIIDSIALQTRRSEAGKKKNAFERIA